MEVKIYEKLFKRLKRACSKCNEFWKKEMIPLTYEENKPYKKQKVCYICKKVFSFDDDKGIAFNKKYHKVSLPLCWKI